MNLQPLEAGGSTQTVEIYGLFDPSGALRYIGKAINASERFKGHLRDCQRRNTPVYCWIKSLLAKGEKPTMKVIGTAPKTAWQKAEKDFIAAARTNGERLLNVADGGDEPFCSTETRSKNGKTTAAVIKELPFWIHASKSMTHAIKSALSNGDMARVELYSEAKKALCAMSYNHRSEFNKAAQNRFIKP